MTRPRRLLILGEGFQNNHHRYPASARFSYLAHEIDLGYGACLTLEAAGVLQIDRASLMPRPAATASVSTTV